MPKSPIGEIIESPETPQVLKDYISYVQVVKGKSSSTAKEYFLDLRMFFRYLKQIRGLTEETDINKVSIADVDAELVRSVTLTDIYNFLLYTANERTVHPGTRNPSVGLGAASRARKASSLRQFFKYASTKAHIIESNPTQDLETPTVKRKLPRYLTLEQSKQLLAAVDGPYKERDYCMIMILLNCGLRVSELIGLNTTDIQEDKLRVLGKGNKERILYLNDVCKDAINDYLPHRLTPKPTENPHALFISRNRNRMSRRSVELMVTNTLKRAGLYSEHMNVHLLRHTAATSMFQHGGTDIRNVQSVLGHSSIATTEIYTHVVNSSIEEALKKQADLYQSEKKQDTDEDIE
ncbi:MAG: tyrosine-type recombinase/integrase [Butyricicoccus sp.]